MLIWFQRCKIRIYNNLLQGEYVLQGIISFLRKTWLSPAFSGSGISPREGR